METRQFTFGPPPRPSFFRRSLLRHEAESSTPPSSLVSLVVVADNKKKAEGPGEASRALYLERVNDLDLEDLACRQELVELLGLKSLSHEGLSNH